jgi:hypothetical protein
MGSTTTFDIAVGSKSKPRMGATAATELGQDNLSTDQ